MGSGVASKSFLAADFHPPLTSPGQKRDAKAPAKPPRCRGLHLFPSISALYLLFRTFRSVFPLAPEFSGNMEVMHRSIALVACRRLRGV